MRRHVLLFCFTAIAATAAQSSRAEAQLTTNTCPSVKGVPPACNQPNYGLSLAELRTTKGKQVVECCRQYIENAFAGAVAGKAHETVAMADGSLVSGVRE